MNNKKTGIIGFWNNGEEFTNEDLFNATAPLFGTMATVALMMYEAGEHGVSAALSGIFITLVFTGLPAVIFAFILADFNSDGTFSLILRRLAVVHLGFLSAYWLAIWGMWIRYYMLTSSPIEFVFGSIFVVMVTGLTIAVFYGDKK